MFSRTELVNWKIGKISELVISTFWSCWQLTNSVVEKILWSERSCRKSEQTKITGLSLSSWRLRTKSAKFWTLKWKKRVRKRKKRKLPKVSFRKGKIRNTKFYKNSRKIMKNSSPITSLNPKVCAYQTNRKSAFTVMKGKKLTNHSSILHF